MSIPPCFQAEYVDAEKLPNPIPRSPTPIDRTFDDVMNLLQADRDKEAKQVVRAQHWPLDHPRRGELWARLSMNHVQCLETFDGDYATAVKDSLGPLAWPSNIPTFTDPIYCEDYLLNAEGQRRAERLIYVISVSHPFITYCPLLHPLASLFLHYISEAQSYECLCALIEGTTVRHLSQTRLMHNTSAYALMQLTKRLCGKTYSRLLSKVGKEEEMEKLFRTWELWIFRGLPLYHLVRAVDCFLLEGVRALYRVAMAILSLYIQEHASEFQRQSLFHRILPGKKRGAGNATGHLGLVLENIVYFSRDIPVDVDVLLKTAYGIQGFSTQVLNKHLLKAETYIRSHSSNSPRCSSTVTLGLEQSDLPSMGFLRGPKQERYNKLRAINLGMFPLADFTSEVFDAEQMVFLWSWLPPRISILQPQVIYSTNEHGSSLNSFYNQVDTWEPTVLAICTTEGDRFGAYCSTQWQERKQAYFGTGETFLFTFSPEARCFPWAGVHATSDVPHTSKLFLSGDQRRILVGAGNGFGLYIDGNLENGRTQHCDTFDNMPLTPSGDFIIRVLEAFGFS